jgi:formimidoylglutamate deiminase
VVTSSGWLPDLLYTGGLFVAGTALVCDGSGKIVELTDQDHSVIPLKNQALLPGLVNAHSHAFQRVIRGRTEHRTGRATDSFWTWREMMYSAATRLSPEDVYDASRMAFLEMALSGITCVGEFHYLHHAADGKPYDDSNLLAKEAVRAARDVGLRIALLRVGYFRSGYQLEPNPRQARFIEPDVESYLKNVSSLQSNLSSLGGSAWVGLAPHSVRGVPLDHLRAIFSFAEEKKLPIHMHVAEQPAEVAACVIEYGQSPIALLAEHGLLNERFTAVHAIHVTNDEVAAMAKAQSSVCACPTTERNLGDGVVPADTYLDAGVPIALGSDSQAQIDLLEDARELEYHVRLERKERSILAPLNSNRSGLAQRLFECATISGADSLGAASGKLDPGCPADFFTVDLDDPSIAGSGQEDLLSGIVFSLARTAIRDVFVGGKPIVREGMHVDQEEIVGRFKALQRRLWS